MNMNKITAMTVLSTMLLAGACSEGTSNKDKDEPIIEQAAVKITDGRMTPEALWAMGRIGGMNVSPDGKRIVYSVAFYSIPQNKSNRELFVMNIDGSDNKQITKTRFNENEAVWLDNDNIVFLCNESEKSQLWMMKADGSNRKQISDYDGDIEGFRFSPDHKKVLFISQVKTVKSTADKYPDLDKATGVIVNDLNYKHWDEWVTTAPHPFVAEFDGKKVGEATDIMKGEPYESPMKPFGGIEQLAWDTNSSKIAYTSRKATGLKYALTTNSDIYIYDLATKKTEDITTENKGYDTNPQFSPDGKQIAWLSMEREGYEADQNRLMIMDLASKQKQFVSKAFDSNVDAFVWAPDSKKIWFTGVWHGEIQIYALNLANDSIVPVTEGVHDYGTIVLGDKNGTQLIAMQHSFSQGDELYAVATDGSKKVKQLSFVNKKIYDQLEMGRVEARWMKTTDNKQMLTWIIYPPHFDKNKKYPTLLYCEGGPQSAVSQFWSYRWNMQIMAANDYIIVAPNRRGLPGFGMEWNEEISGDYGGQCMKDYFTAIDEFAKEPFVDKDHLGCVGASFGGYSVYWIAGHHDGRFKAFIAHDGIFNMEMQYLETEELWFENWDMGGAFWDKKNAVAQKSFSNSPHLFVDRWDTPILCIHGEKDYRILASQGMAAFDAAVIRGIPAELLIYPDENHWVLQPQNGILWQRTFFEWLDRWLKPAKK